MTRGGRRRAPRAPAALRWIATDARDVVRIDWGATRRTVAVPTIARGVRSWQRRVERRRLLALIRRGALVAAAAACALQVGALALGNSGPDIWLVPAAIVAAVAVAFGLAHPTSAAAAARLLDRDLQLGAEVSTALELEAESKGIANPHGLAALALADGRGALDASLAGRRVRLRARRGELALLAALVTGLVVLLLVPSPRDTGTTRAAAPAKARTAQGSARALRVDSGLATRADPGPSLQELRQVPLDAPPLAAVQADGTTRAGGAASGHNPYGGGLANSATSGATQPASSTSGQSGSVKGTDDGAGAASGARQGKGSLPDGAPGEGTTTVPGGSSGSKGGAGAPSVAPIPNGRPRASAPRDSSPGTAGRSGGQSRGSTGSSAPGRAAGATSKTTSGGTGAGSTSGGKNRGTGVVPQLGGKTGLPIAPGYEAVPGFKEAKNEKVSSAAGRGGGAGHSGQAIGGTASGGRTGVPYVPPGSAAVAAIDRSVVLGYFASFARVNASGW